MWKYPKTQIKTVKEKIHGKKIRDAYRWLENGESKEVAAWVRQQNDFVRKTLGKYVDTKKYQAELDRYMKSGSVGTPGPFNGKYFWTEYKAGQNQPVVRFKEGLSGKAKILIDVNKIRKDGTISLDYWRVSPKGKYVGYGLSEGGTEMSTLQIMDVNSVRNLPDKIPNARYAGIQWLPDESGFYYAKNPAKGSVPKGDEHYYRRLYFHLLGTDSAKDRLIFGKDLAKEQMPSADLSPDGRYLAITTTDNWTSNDLYLYDVVAETIRPVTKGIKAKFNPFLNHGKIFLLTDYKAEKFRVLAADLSELPKSVKDWEVLIPESARKLENLSLTEDKILAEYLVNASSVVNVFDYAGKLEGKLPVLELSTVSEIGCRRTEKEFFFKAVSFFSSGTIWHYNDLTKKYSVYYQDSLKLDSKKFAARQVWYGSKDGIKVPMFVFGRADMKKDGQNSVLLYGYGGFAVSSTPGFFKGWLPFLKRGGVIVVANIRGGGEFGEQWHKDGILNKKQNSFDDFIAAAEYLIGNNYTNPEKLAIFGGSNGGLLVGACAVQRPDLFKAVISKVPLLDMVRFHKFLIAGRWVNEYGDPRKAKDLDRILKWSPYHNVRQGVEYPNILFTTANKDFRVDPLHARKTAALLQATNKRNVVLLRTEMEAGHGPGKSLAKVINEQADALAFLEWQLQVN